MAICYSAKFQPSAANTYSNTGTETEAQRVYYAFTSNIANVLRKLHIKITIVL